MEMDITKISEMGYKLYEQKYDNGVRYYTIEKPLDESSTKYLGDICIKTGNKFAKMFNIEIVPATKTSVALNYEPVAPRLNMFRS